MTISLIISATPTADLQQQLQQPRPFSSNAVRKPHSIEDPTRLPTHHEERPPAYSRVSRTRTPSPTKPMSRSSAVAAANAEMARSASITTSPSKAERERGRERERERGMERERERESRERDTDSTGLEESVVNAFAELYKQIMESLTSDEFAKFAAVVSAFNASQKTAEETVRDVEVIVKSRDLFLRFKALVSRALQEREKAEAAASASAEA
ncbi:hypothetical protein BC938DRAFT_484014 [Jimgerdemannia flammicorona]|uniref:At4g15545-like C-terminal domain-containing protein n=1 Tax=Jimgerdemannia flammicorona TaxID=994334 RepID=A0A433QAW2_9FUNG|nr:hypothetical protein BC938DRAFT_484014 [Jimgerdemannia flammicorona]